MMFRFWIKLQFGAILMAVLTACSSHIPPNIREPLEASADIAQIIADPALYHDRRIRWAGVILSIENGKNHSSLTIVAFPPGDAGRPLVSAQSPGRFIARVNEFLEPLVYRKDREITVVGRFQRIEPGKVGEFEYDFPVIEVDEFYLWPKRDNRVDYRGPYYSPYWHPYSPFYPWPYFHHHDRIHF